jgi:hypothetical protein
VLLVGAASVIGAEVQVPPLGQLKNAADWVSSRTPLIQRR